MRFELGFGKTVQTLDVPDGRVLAVLTPNAAKALHGGGEEEVRHALSHPTAAPRLSELVRRGEKIAVISSDVTRPMPTYAVMPALLDELYAAGVRKEDITLVFGLGSHRRQTEEEKRRLAGERAYAEIKVIDSDPDDCIRLGVTGRGTPVDVTRAVAEADRRICLGNVEFHYFAGYSGGAKAIMPGISSREAIECNHSMMVDENSCAGKLSGNPLRADIEEAGGICGIDYILNVVLDEHKKIVFAAAGDATAAHRECCAFLDGMYRIEIERKADIVVACMGGAPKDLNLYQTQKALENAKYAVKKGGVVILMGECAEGVGGGAFERWMREAEKPQDMIDRLAQKFVLGGHKGAALALVLKNADVYMVSAMDKALVEDIFLVPFTDVQQAYDAAAKKLGEKAETIIMPYGGSTLPRVKE